MRELDELASHLKELIRAAEVQGRSMQQLPAWLLDWESPWKGNLTCGELISQGEDEMYHLGIRIREKFPQLFSKPYHPDVYNIMATQVHRASASAVAFGMGLLGEKGSLGPGRRPAFAVTGESRANDTILRFHESCENYKVFKKRQEPAVDKLKEPVLDEITSALVYRYVLNFTRQDTAYLWFLCKQEASLLNVTDQACGLFSSYEVALLEWTDDLGLFILKGYGNSINYRMGVPLLKDVVHSMEQAVKAHEGDISAIASGNIFCGEKHAPGSYEKARLRFAHAETVVPFSCLLGLFLEGSEFEKIRREQPLELPLKPPQSRNWRGSIVAPFAGNNMLALYSCPPNPPNKYFVQVLHNKHPIPLPGCSNSDFCPFQVFKERIVALHINYDFNMLCGVKQEQPWWKSVVSKLLLLFRGLFCGGDKTDSIKGEL